MTHRMFPRLLPEGELALDQTPEVMVLDLLRVVDLVLSEQEEADKDLPEEVDHYQNNM